MEKSEFVNWLFKQFKMMLSSAEKVAETEISGRKSRSDKNSFNDWLVKEHEKAANHPALPVYDMHMAGTMDTPKGAAENLTNLIAFDLDGKENWQEQYECAFPLLTNIKPEKSEGWKYRGFFRAYMEAAKADKRARVFAKHIEQDRTKNKGNLIPAFGGLFVSEMAAERAFNAAVSAGIIDDAGKRLLGERKIVSSIIQFWEAVSDPKFELTHIRASKDAVGETYVKQCHIIAKQFGTEISDSAIYDHAGERAGKYFTAVASKLGGK